MHSLSDCIPSFLSLCHACKHCWKSFCERLLGAVVTLLWASSFDLKWYPFKERLSFGNLKKPHGAKWVEYSGCSNTDIFLACSRNIFMWRNIVIQNPLSDQIVRLFLDECVASSKTWRWNAWLTCCRDTFMLDISFVITKYDEHYFDPWFWNSVLGSRDISVTDLGEIGRPSSHQRSLFFLEWLASSSSVFPRYVSRLTPPHLSHGASV
jgi:hypothetical protein